MDKLIVFKFTIMTMLFLSFFNKSKETVVEEEAIQIVKICTNGHDIPSVCVDGDENIAVNEDGFAWAPLDIHLANLVPSGLNDEKYILQPGSPPMFVEYDKGNGEIGVVPVTEFDADGDVEGIDMYIAIVLLPFDFGLLCDDSGNDNSAPYSSNARLISDEANNVEGYYPIHAPAHSGVGGMFTCEIFVETCGDCDSANGLCDLNTNTDPQSNFYFCVDCKDANGGGGGSKRSSDEESDLKTTQSNESLFASVKPNPFNSSFNLELNMQKEGQVSIQIFDSRGKAISTITKNAASGSSSLSIDSQDWPSGVYYCQISMESDIQLLKLVRL